MRAVCRLNWPKGARLSHRRDPDSLFWCLFSRYEPTADQGYFIEGSPAMGAMQHLESRICAGEMRVVGLTEFGHQGADHAQRFREAVTAKGIEMNENMGRGCRGSGAALTRHTGDSLPSLPSTTSRRTHQMVPSWSRQTRYR